MLSPWQAERGETGEEQSQEHEYQFILASQTAILHTAVTFYGDCVKMCKDFAPNFGDKILGV
jgi:hypothetical protein